MCLSVVVRLQSTVSFVDVTVGGVGSCGLYSRVGILGCTLQVALETTETPPADSAV